MLAIDIAFSISKLLLGIIVFLLAVKVFSSSLKGQFLHKMQPAFLKVSRNRFAALGVGAGATALMQSSTATTVLTVGLVNAGAITLFGATAIIMGANVGTTLTSLLVSLSSFKIGYIFMATCFIGVAIYVSAKDESKSKNIGSLLIGFGGIFIALELLSLSFSDSAFLTDIFEALFSRVTFPLLLILLGAMFTAIIQSSSASMAIYITMLASGVLCFASSVFLLFGSEIGTCLTTLIAASKANTVAKRAAVVHLLFNLFSATIFTAIFWPLGHLIIPAYTAIVTNPMWQLSIFQVAYNLITVAILIWAIKPMNWIVERLVRKRTNTVKRKSGERKNVV